MGDRASGTELQDTALALGTTTAPLASREGLATLWLCHGTMLGSDLCSVGLHISWHFTYRDNSCRSPKLPLSSGSSETKADMICHGSTSPMLVTASCSC